MTPREIEKLFERAPEDATHCFAATPEFYKKDGELWLVWFSNAKKWHCSVVSERIDRLIQRPTIPQWNGEGLPPVGVVCRATWCGSNQGDVTVLFMGDDFAVLRNHGHGEEQCGPVGEYKFTPIRTPEQIAAEERATIIQRMWSVVTTDCSDVIGIQRRVCADLYDAGYRKP